MPASQYAGQFFPAEEWSPLPITGSGASTFGGFTSVGAGLVRVVGGKKRPLRKFVLDAVKQREPAHDAREAEREERARRRFAAQAATEQWERDEAEREQRAADERARVAAELASRAVAGSGASYALRLASFGYGRVARPVRGAGRSAWGRSEEDPTREILNILALAGEL